MRGCGCGRVQLIAYRRVKHQFSLFLEGQPLRGKNEMDGDGCTSVRVERCRDDWNYVNGRRSGSEGGNYEVNSL